MRARTCAPAIALASIVATGAAWAAPPDASGGGGGDDLDVPAATASPAPAPPASPAPAPPASAAPSSDELVRAAEDRARAAEDRARAAEDRARAAEARPADAHPIDLGIRVDGYLQAQYQTDQASQDQIAQGGSYLNQDGFVLRRARIAFTRDWQYAAAALELDANTVHGAVLGLRRAEASLVWPSATDPELPLAALAVGVTDIPFGFEMLERTRDRLFAERSTASQAFFPGEADAGARLWGGIGHVRYQVALEAGRPFGAGDSLPDPTAAKDLVARVGGDAAPRPSVHVSGGVSLVAGTGFHAGTSATKASVEWNDTNENGVIDAGELVGVPGAAATPSQTFRRWALGADLELAVTTRWGATRVWGEVTVASNLDRGLYVADPVSAGGDVRELGAYVAALQDLGPRAFAGARVDLYDPNLDALDSRLGTLIPVDARILTFSPLVGVRLPWHARVSVQYDHIVDDLARDARGVPTDLRNDRITARLQVDL